MTVKGGTSQACAACKYQRRKCSADCPLAPYFPPDQPKMFQNAHRLFGVSNILKILKQLSPSQKMEAMRSIVFQANMREKFPVHGCWGIICQLKFQIEQAHQELIAVNTQLALCRQHHQHRVSSPPPQHHSPSSQLQLGMASANNALPLFQHHPQQNFNTIANGISFAPSHHSLSNGNYNDYMEYSKDNIMNPLWVENSFNDNDDKRSNNNSMTIQSHFLMSQPLSIQQEVAETAQDYDEISPFFDIIDDRQSYIDSKEANDSSSSEESLKDTTRLIEHVSENDLKSAAACFSLTSVN